ncbi:MAG TPA: zinc ribbon domain-containing protein, partial [Ktedonobacterales bacterium]|nr:zinc ribbon domain-containing protein [Ktedonobacterales bacterium]
MANQAGGLICGRCGWANAPGARYCVHCGEIVDIALAAELQRLYTLLIELDAQVAAGLGSGTVQSLRDTIRERYLAQRTATRAAPSAASVTRPLPQSAASHPIAPGAASASTTIATGAADAVPAAAAFAPPAPARPHGPVFSWRAFIAEQAIAVMAYLGGFLLLIATLTFEVGGWQALPDFAKLAGVLAVYFLFGLLGAALRHATSLRTVGRVYLGVFALMTPLAALAVYRFELQARGFPVAGTICLAAGYTAIVYLSLATRTRFVTYAYLGWAALLLGALAIPPWANVMDIWRIPVANIVALALVAPHAASRRRGPRALLEVLEPSATQLSAGVAVVGALTTIMLSLQIAGNAFMPVEADSARAALAVAACALVALAAAWSWTARTITVLSGAETVSVLDWIVAASVALAAVAVAGWLHATAAGYTYTLAGVALAEGLAVEALRARAPRRVGLRISIKILAAVLVVLGAMLTIGEALPNAPLLVAGAVAIMLGLLFALRGSRREVFPWGLFAGAFLLIEAQAAFAAMIPADLLDATSDHLAPALAQRPTLTGLLALALAALGLGLRAAPAGSSRLRKLRAPIELTALLDATFASLQLGGHTRLYSALFLSMFALAALLVARIERQPFLAGAWVTIFGVSASVSFLVGNPNSVAVAALPVALALATLLLGRALGRAYSVAVYLVTLIATLIAFVELITALRASADRIIPTHPGLGGWMAIIVALILMIDALATQAPLWRLAPAGAALLSVVDARALWPAVTLTLALAGMGALLRRLRGAYWETSWHAAATLASLIALYWAMRATQNAASLTLGVAPLFALLTYVIAWQDHLPWVSAAITPYVLVSLWQVDSLPIPA